MGRIREAFSIASFLATSGNATPVRWESSAEKAAREQAQLMSEQNRLLADIARQGQSREPVAAMACCEECRRLGCDARMNATSIAWVKTRLICDCATHHPAE
jgi:hypothetical protein